MHLVTATGLVILLASTVTRFAWDHSITAGLIAVAFVALYRPIQHIWLALLPARIDAGEERSLAMTMQGLGETLDMPTLASTLIDGVENQFGYPALALFLGDVEGSSTLNLHALDHMNDLPTTLIAGHLTAVLRSAAPVTESRTLRQKATDAPLSEDDQQLLMHPAIVLWCPIRHPRGHLLGLLVLGMRADLDPYRTQDRQDLQRLIASASLAFTNSAAYVQQQEAEATIRQLYQRLQAAQDAIGFELARELHDEVINVHLNLNIKALKTIEVQIDDAMLRQEIALILESQQTIIDVLRRICEQLYPTGVDDLLGLPGVLRVQVQKVQAHWQGVCHLEITGHPCPISGRVQREALRVMKEGLTNAVKHANATLIRVELRYPAGQDELVRLAIVDDGRTPSVIGPKVGHLGLRSMQEAARSVGGQLIFRSEHGKGTTVEFAFPRDVGSPPALSVE